MYYLGPIYEFHYKKINYSAIMACEASDEEIEIMEEVELSSDEEVDDDDEVSLIILKRPPAITRTVQDVEVRLLMAA